MGFPDGPVAKKSACQVQRCRMDLWVGKISWRREWQPTPVFSLGKSHRQRRLEGYSPWGCKRVGHDWATKQQQESSVFVTAKIKKPSQSLHAGHTPTRVLDLGSWTCEDVKIQHPWRLAASCKYPQTFSSHLPLSPSTLCEFIYGVGPPECWGTYWVQSPQLFSPPQGGEGLRLAKKKKKKKERNNVEKEMAAYSGILAWEIPWAEEPGGLQRKWKKVKVSVVQSCLTLCDLMDCSPQVSSVADSKSFLRDLRPCRAS